MKMAQEFKNSEDKERYKVIVIGDKDAGKSAFVSTLCTGTFPTDEKCEENVKIYHTSFLLSDCRSVKMNIWNIPSEEITEKNIIGANAVIFMFDITKKRSRESLSVYYENIFRLLGEVPMVVCANKADRRKEISPARVKGHTEKIFPKNIEYIEISSLDNKNLKKPIEKIIRGLLSDKDLYLL